MKVRTEKINRRNPRRAREIRNRKPTPPLPHGSKKKGTKNLKQVAADKRPPLRWFGLTELGKKAYSKSITNASTIFERELKRYEPYAFSVYNGPPNNFRSTKAVNLIPGAQETTGRDRTDFHPGRWCDHRAHRTSPHQGVLSAVAGSNNVKEPNGLEYNPQLAGRPPFGTGPLDRQFKQHTDRTRDRQSHLADAFRHPGWSLRPNNFGQKGAKPSHPELLDWLATWFMGSWLVNQKAAPSDHDVQYLSAEQSSR